MENFKIRRATSEDAGRIAFIKCSCWRDTYKGIVSDSFLQAMSLNEITAAWAKILSAENTRNTTDALTNGDGEIIGFVSYGKNRFEKFKADAEIMALYLLKEYRGKELGAQLFTHGISQLKDMDIHSFYLFVLAQNPALNFYRKFKPAAEYADKINIGGVKYDDVALVWR